MKSVHFTILSVIVTFFAFSSFAQTRDTILYVNAAYTGSIENGSSANPYKTIRKALDRRQAMGIAGMVTNEQIIVKAGNYYPSANDMLLINRYNCGRNGKWLTIRSEVPFAATIRGDSLYKTRFAAIVSFTDSAAYVTLKHFTIEHLRCNPDSTRWKNTDGSYTATVPTVMAMENGHPARTAYGDTIYEAQKDVKFGIQVVSDCRHIKIFDNDISDISWTNNVDPYKADSAMTEAERKILRNAWPNDNAGPLNVLGTDFHAMQDIIIDGNEVHHCFPGWTEAITVNGYLDSFKVINNLVHDVHNIGIVAAGNYTWVLDSGNGFNTPSNQNFARNGVISDNIVYNCLSPIAASAGIYLDGSRNVLIERNQVYNNHVGISIGNETPNSSSGGHTVRNNIIYDNVWTGMVLGSNGYNAWVENVKVLNNTFYKNNTRIASLLPQRDNNQVVLMQSGVAVAQTFSDGGEIVTQRLSNSNNAPNAKIVVQNNIFRSRKGSPVTTLWPFRLDGYSGTALVKSNLKSLLDWNYNLYYIEPGFNNAVNYDFAAAGFTGNTYNFANYKNTVGIDSNSVALELATMPSPDPVFTGGTAFPGRYSLVNGSAAYNIGNPSSTNSGLEDFVYNNRIRNGRIDAGALEIFVSGARMADAAPQPKTETVSVGIYPNPATEQITTRFLSPGKGMVDLYIIDINGKIMLQKKVAVTGGYNSVIINNLKGAHMSGGTYLLKLSGAGISQNLKFVVQ